MSESPLLYVPGLSLFMRFLNWTMPAVGVPIEQLRPDPAYVRLIRDAVYDIRICQGIFGGWAAQLDKIRSEEFEEQERMLRHHLTLLREDVSWCSRATDAILLCHAEFAYLTAQRIDDASSSWLKSLPYGQDATRLANELNKASGRLSEQVAHMQGNLNSFVSALEKTGGRSIARQVLRWLKYLLNTLASIFELGSFVSPFLHTVSSRVNMIAPDGSTLCNAASALREVASEICPGKESECIESVLLFLKDTVPKEAQAAQRRLAEFNEALFVMGLEERMMTGRRVTLCGPDPNFTAVAQEWRKIAKQYQSMLPDDEGNDGAMHLTATASIQPDLVPEKKSDTQNTEA